MKGLASRSARDVLAGGALLLSSLLGACGDTRPEPIGTARLEIIGGLAAPSGELDHTGALIRMSRTTGAASVLCTATLIGPETAVTARHCVAPLAAFERLGEEVAWAWGPKADSESPLVPVVATEVPEPSAENGALGLGFDVALIHFAEPVDVAPAAITAFDPNLLGRSMVTLGYGMPAARFPPDGLRRIGRETVVAVEGRVYEILYGGFESFLDAAAAGSASDEDSFVAAADDAPTLSALRAQYEDVSLIPEHELITRTLSQNTRGCRGDSGGPLLRVGPHGDWQVHGVLSGGPRSARAECDIGQVYATFGPRTFEFVERGRNWTDPCGDVDEVGACEGELLRRCDTRLAAGVRRLVMQDCRDTAQACLTSGAFARCGAASEADASTRP